MKLSYSDIKMLIVMIKNWGYKSTINILEIIGSSHLAKPEEINLCENSLTFIDKYETKLIERYSK